MIGTSSGIDYGTICGICGICFILIATIYIIIKIVYIKSFEKESSLLGREISKYRKVICDGPAKHGKGFNNGGGWLFLSEDAIEFYPHKMNTNAKNIPILLDDISNVETKFNHLIITTKKETYTFVVQKCKFWKKSIMEIL